MASKVFPEWIPTADSPINLATPSETLPGSNLAVVRVEMGGCQFYYKASARFCDCASGSVVGAAQSLSQHDTCDECGHFLSLHKAYSAHPPSYNIRVIHPEVCPRINTVRKLAALLDEKRILHIRGTPSSGKSTLAGLLVKHYRECDEPVVFIHNWDDNIANPASYLQQCCAANGYQHAEVNFWESNFIFILDEAQSSYGDSAFWLGVIKTRHGCLTGPRFCLFASYGSPTTGAPPYQYSSRVTPVHLGPAQRVGITRSRLPGSPDVCLFYDEAEFNDAVDRICARPSVGFIMDADAREYLYTITNGHPGAVNALVAYAYEANRYDLKHGTISSVSKYLMTKSLEDDAQVFRSLESYPVFRSFPAPNVLTMPVVTTLRRCLKSGTIPCDLNDEGVKRCYELGWLHSDQTKSFAELFLYTFQPRPFPFEQFPSITALCQAIIRKFSQKNLGSSVEIELAPSRFRRPPEAQFQDELYRCFFDIVGYGVGLSSEWSRAGDGRIDFRVVEPRWGIEVLRDGDRLSDHCNRFRPGGAYYPWITQGYIRDWLILDFRHTPPQKYSIPGTKLWRIVFQDQYASAYIVDAQNVIVTPEFPLLQ
ncbi:hypothetical protein ARAM_003943 [Aspergillus rambellii]|uniref:Uncharacterized protein n=1 Tax=Aspergillus rambellii TaxID=308745 RepID=A0A0F8X1Y8_9EURO|nr:hypothetical protein ARAM_003943 [Aspergillus rambellii]